MSVVNGKPTRTLFSYVGGKKQWMAKWCPLLPPHTLYASVFGGSGADIIFKPPSEIEVFNDIDGDINNLFRVLRHQHQDLMRLIEFTPARSRATFHEAVLTLHDPGADPLNRAWAFLVVAHQVFRSKHPRLHGPSGYAAVKAAKKCIPQWINLPDTIKQIVERFRSVQLEQLDFRDVIQRYDGADTLFFVDPPYHPDTRTNNCYLHEMTEEDHDYLLTQLNEVRGKVWLCGYDHDLYRDRLRRWRKREFVTHSPHSTKATRTEVVWTNFVPIGKRQ